MEKPFIKYEEVKDVSAKNYFSEDIYAVDIFNTKYAKLKDTGEPETPAEVFWRVADSLSNIETKDENKDKLRAAAFSYMYDGWFRPGGSIIAGIGSNRKSSLMNCTTIPLVDDTLEAIARCEYDIMKTAAWRQGIGVDFSKLRPRGSKLGNAAMESTGVIPWMDKLNRVGDYVGQLGRKPALLLSLNVDHPDIEEFISCKDSDDKINNANISVQITNDFMEQVRLDGEWELRFEVKDSKEIISKKIGAKKLFRMIAEHANLTAEPGVQYRNLLQDGIMYKAIADHLGDNRYLPHSSNACSEKFMAPYSVCNLSSINMEMFSTKEVEYLDELEAIIPIIVRLADNVITYELQNNLSPLKEQKWIVEQLREIGMGITNVHGWLLKQDIAYDSDEAINKIEHFMKHYARIVFRTSMELGKEKGDAPAFNLLEDKSLYMNTSYFRNIVNTFYNGDAANIKNMRNMAHMSIAPAGSLSTIFPKPCVSSGIEPCIGLAYWRRTRALDKGNYTYYFIIPNRLRDYVLTKMTKDSNDYKLLFEFSGSAHDEDGKIGKSLVGIMYKYVPEGFFKPAHEISPSQKIKLMSKVYNWLDASISCTYNLPSTATVEDIEAIYMEAYLQGVRAVSVYRDGSRQGILIFEDPITNKNKYENKKLGLCPESLRPKKITPNCAPKRPKTLSCAIHHVSVQGTPWIVIAGLLENEIYELFAGSADSLYIPKTCKEGTITKNSGGKYSLTIKIKGQEIEYKDVTHTLMDSDERALTRLISLGLRHGCLEFTAEQLKKANGDISQFSTVVARVLGSYIKDYRYSKSNKCPNCEEGDMVRSENCEKCIICGFSRCG